MSKRLGFFCLPGRGHLYPAVALARRLRKLGCTVVFFSQSVARAIPKKSEFPFVSLAGAKPSRAFRNEIPKIFAGPDPVDTIYRHAQCVLESALDEVINQQLDGLLVDQADLAAGTVADALNIPFVNVSMFPPIYLNDDVPPFIFGWAPHSEDEDLRRNRRGNDFLRRILSPTVTLVNAYRHKLGLPIATDINDLFSRLAIVSQLPDCLDFPRRIRVPSLYHCGNFYDSTARRELDFPWQQLTGKPIIYASMGTVRTGSSRVFEIIAEACACFDVQLVVSLGGMQLMPNDLGSLPGNPIIVHFAPQMDILKRSALCITHGGLNTVLESVTCGVPMITIPVTDDQPGVGARVCWYQIGLTLPFKLLTVNRLQETIAIVLQNHIYRKNVAEKQRLIRKVDGVGVATDIVSKMLMN